MAGVSMKDIKSRIRSMEPTKQITKAMEMVAASKLRGAQDRAVSSRPYFETLYATMNDIADSTMDFVSPYLTKKEGKTLFIVIAGDRGLAGGYNSNVLKLAWSKMQACESAVLPIGKKALDFFRQHGAEILTDGYAVAGEVSVGDCFSAAKLLCRRFVSGEFTQAGSEVSALLGRMPSAVGYQPTLATEMGALQERITSTKNGSITSVQAVYVPADDLTDPAPATTFAHLDATTVLDRGIASLGIYPAVDPLDSTSRILAPEIVGQEHYDVARSVIQLLQRYKELQDIIAIMGMDELSEADQLAVSRARKVQRFLSQPFHVAEQFTGFEGKYVPLKETIRGFREIVEGKHDDIPESAFLFAGSIDDVVAKAKGEKV